MTGYKGTFTNTDATALTGCTATVIEWEDDESDRRLTYPDTLITGYGPGYLTIQADDQQRNIFFSAICEVVNARKAEGPHDNQH